MVILPLMSTVEISQKFAWIPQQCSSCNLYTVLYSLSLRGRSRSAHGGTISASKVIFSKFTRVSRVYATPSHERSWENSSLKLRNIADGLHCYAGLGSLVSKGIMRAVVSLDWSLSRGFTILHVPRIPRIVFQVASRAFAFRFRLETFTGSKPL